MATRKPLFVSSDGFPEEMATTDDLQLGGLASTGNITLSGGATVTGLPTPSAASDAASKSYVDAFVQGLDVHASARVATAATLTGWTASGSGVGKTLTSPDDNTSHNTFDGVTVSVNDRILVKNGPTSPDQGIYVMTTLADGAGQNAVITRATDADEDTEVTAGLFLFVTEGSTLADTGWVLTTNDPITVDTSNQDFSQFSGAGSFVGGDGIDITGNTISVDLDTDAGLEFDTGKLQVKLDGTTLSRTASGLSVLGLPSLFTVNGVAVGATVTAANLDDLTDGSNSDALHDHSAVTGAKSIREDHNVNEAISVGDPVEWSTTNDRIQKGDAAVNSKTDVFGIAITAQATIGNPATILKRGVATGVIAGATAGDRYYLAAGGGLTPTIPVGSGNNIVLVGTAKNATDLEVHPQFIGRRA